MKVYSGIIKPKDGFHRRGSAVINFGHFPLEGESQGDATVALVRTVGGTGNFSKDPAFLVGFRESIYQDKARGKNERDHWKLTTRCEVDELEITWEVYDKGAKALEISFLVIGE